jgi:Cdc6-like AAA superfamily ATPase
VYIVYPYNLKDNPYPSSPTPTLIDARVLGGPRHKEAKNAVLNCIKELSEKVSNETGASQRDFRLITVIQDVGAGKTHLALHTKSTQDNIICSYLDLSTVSPKNLTSLYAALIDGFSDQYVKQLKVAVVDYVKSRAIDGDRLAKKTFRPPFFGGKSVEVLAQEVIDGKRAPDIHALNEFLIGDFSVDERTVIKQVMFDDFKNTSKIQSLEHMLTHLSAIGKLNLRFLKKVTLLEMDEFDSNTDSIEFVKAVINAHLPSAILLLITTPSIYADVRNVAPSVFDRLEKANYKIDLAGSSTFDEISDIVLEYMRQDVKDLTFSSYESDIISKVRVIYDEFHEFRSIRSMLNIMYHAMEISKRENAGTITENSLDETIKQAYPGLRVRGSIMNVPISEFIRIRRDCTDSDVLESNVKEAVKSLVMFAHEQGKVSKPEPPNGKGADGNVDALYKTTDGTKTAVTVVIDKDHGKSIEKISNVAGLGAERHLVLTNAHTDGVDGTTVVNMDKCKMIDLIYFSRKYKNEEIADADSDRAIMLAKSISIC